MFDEFDIPIDPDRQLLLVQRSIDAMRTELRRVSPYQFDNHGKVTNAAEIAARQAQIETEMADPTGHRGYVYQVSVQLRRCSGDVVNCEIRLTTGRGGYELYKPQDLERVHAVLRGEKKALQEIAEYFLPMMAMTVTLEEEAEEERLMSQHNGQIGAPEDDPAGNNAEHSRSLVVPRIPALH